MLFAVWSMSFCLASMVDQAVCGVTITFFAFNNMLPFFGGSSAKTSNSVNSRNYWQKQV
jgi:hypothetical protein